MLLEEHDFDGLVQSVGVKRKLIVKWRQIQVLLLNFKSVMFELVLALTQHAHKDMKVSVIKHSCGSKVSFWVYTNFLAALHGMG